MAKDKKTKRKKKKTRLILVSLGCLTLAAGYHTGRATSTNWNSKETARLYAYRASYKVTNAPDGAVRALSLPDAEYRYDRKKVTVVPLAAAASQQRYPVLGAEEYETWLKGMVTFAAAAGAKMAWTVLTDSSELKGFKRVLVEERILVAGVASGAFGGGYLLGHTFQQNLDTAQFRAALLDKDIWEGILFRKHQLAEAKANLDTSIEDLKVLRQVGALDAETLELEKQRIHSQYSPASQSVKPWPGLFLSTRPLQATESSNLQRCSGLQRIQTRDPRPRALVSRRDRPDWEHCREETEPGSVCSGIAMEACGLIHSPSPKNCATGRSVAEAVD